MSSNECFEPENWQFERAGPIDAGRPGANEFSGYSKVTWIK